MRPFIVLSLPRSRSAWLSHFLSYGDAVCGHEEIRRMRTLDDVKAWFSQPMIGSAETAAAPWWRLFPKVAPDANIVIVRRPVDDVVESLSRIKGTAYDRIALRAAMEYHARKLDQVEARCDNVLSVNFADLETEATCRAVFEHCLPYSFDKAHWQALDGVNIQINLPAMMRYFEAYRPAIDKLASVARHRILSDMAMRPAREPDGMTFQTETFDGWLEDARHLLEEHHVQIGEDPENWRNKNIPLLRTMFEMGAMQITTARSNGRMFGYLMTLMTPSLATAGMTSAVNTAFFADPSCAGLGLKLQRAALSSFRDQGVGEVLWETNTVGGGNRIGSIYRRLGAEEKGSVFRLKLRECA